MLAAAMVRREETAPVQTLSEAATALARNTSRLRTLMGLSQGKLATEAGLPRKTVYNTEKHGRGEAQTVEKLARVFGVSVATMYELDLEVVEVHFLANQIDKLTADGFDRLSRVSRTLANRAADDKIRPPSRGGDRKGR